MTRAPSKHLYRSTANPVNEKGDIGISTFSALTPVDDGRAVDPLATTSANEQALEARSSTAVGRAEHLADLGTEIATGQRLPAILARRGASLREQVEVLARVVELQYEAVDLVDEMRAAGELVDTTGGRPPQTHRGPVGLSSVGLSQQRVDEWRDLRHRDALAFLRRALDSGREDTLERASVSWLIDRLARISREAEAEDRRQSPLDVDVDDDGIRTIAGDFREALDDVGEVDAIITDPPYPAEFLPLYDGLAELAQRILKPTAPLAVMVGQAHLPDVIARLGAHLTYRWCGAYLTNGAATRVLGRKVGTKWKPVLIYGGTRFLVEDVFRSTTPAGDKRYHEWGQSETGMADLVERLTQPGDLVLDPFLGGGTTAIVCRDLGRRFIGCDIDRAAVAATRERLQRASTRAI